MVKEIIDKRMKREKRKRRERLRVRCCVCVCMCDKNFMMIVPEKADLG